MRSRWRRALRVGRKARLLERATLGGLGRRGAVGADGDRDRRRRHAQGSQVGGRPRAHRRHRPRRDRRCLAIVRVRVRVRDGQRCPRRRRRRIENGHAAGDADRSEQARRPARDAILCRGGGRLHRLVHGDGHRGVRDARRARWNACSGRHGGSRSRRHRRSGRWPGGRLRHHPLAPRAVLGGAGDRRVVGDRAAAGQGGAPARVDRVRRDRQPHLPPAHGTRTDSLHDRGADGGSQHEAEGEEGSLGRAHITPRPDRVAARRNAASVGAPPCPVNTTGGCGWPAGGHAG